MTWYLYIAKCNDGTLYTGITTNPNEENLNITRIVRLAQNHYETNDRLRLSIQRLLLTKKRRGKEKQILKGGKKFIN